MYTCKNCGVQSETGQWTHGAVGSEDHYCGAEECAQLGFEMAQTMDPAFVETLAAASTSAAETAPEPASDDPEPEQPTVDPDPEVPGVEPEQPAEDPGPDPFSEGPADEGVAVEEPLPEPGPAEEPDPQEDVGEDQP